MNNSQKFGLAFMFALMFIITFTNASLGPVAQNECIDIRVLANCSSVNLTEVNNGNSTFLINSPMQNLGGQTWNYTFCNTSRMDTYTYSWNNPCVDCSSNDCGNSFIVNGSGKTVTQEQITLIIIGIVVLLIVCAFFFILSYLFKHPGTKIFLMSLSTITMIVVIGIISSNASVYLAEFPGIVSMYNSYYTVVIALASACMVGIILWLIVYSLKLFNGSRGINTDDD